MSGKTRGSPEFLKILKVELVRRKRRSPLYSIRAFARDLGISPARLSAVLRGEYGFSAAAAEQLATKLALSPAAKKAFVASALKDRASKSGARDSRGASPFYVPISVDQFSVIAEWYHFAILALLDTKEFQPDASWIAKKLSISTGEAEQAIERMKRLKMLQVSNQGRIWSPGTWYLVPSEVPSEATKSFHRQLMQMAQRALFDQALEKRHFSSSILAVKEKDLPEAKHEIDKFRDRFVKRFGDAKKQDRVYAISMQLFAVDTRG